MEPDGPHIDADGVKYWTKNGEVHRDDGPAIEYPNGQKEWCQHGQVHREDGPAVITPDGKEFWVLNDKQVTRQKVEAFMEAKRFGESISASIEAAHQRRLGNDLAQAFCEGTAKPIKVKPPMKLKKPTEQA